MKKAVALITLPLLAGIAHAQSSVTLYGIVQSGIVYVNNQSGHAQTEMVTGQTNGSRFGFLGSEDLGGGMKAIFTLENGFDTSNGKFLQGGLLFGRQAFVGLSGPFGTITLGRQYEPMTEYIGQNIAATSIWAWVATHPGDFDNLNANFRVNNAVKYATPIFNGFQASAIYAPGGVAGSVTANQIYTVGAKYVSGPIYAAIAYDNIRNPAVSAYGGAVSPGQSGFTTPETSPVFEGYASAQTLQIFGAGVLYALGPAKVGLVYTNTRFENVLRTATTPFSGTATFNSFEANARYAITPTLQMAASFDYTKAQTAHYEQVDIGPDYSLSKRTDVFLVGVWQHASGTDSTGQRAVAAIGSLGHSATPNQIAVEASIRTRF